MLNEMKIETGDLVEFISRNLPDQFGLGYVNEVTEDYITVALLNPQEGQLKIICLWFDELANLDPELFSFRVVSNNQRLYFPLEI